MSIYEGLTKPTEELKDYLRHDVNYERNYNQYEIQNTNQGAFARLRRSIRELLGPINPLHTRHMPSKQGHAYLEVRDGNSFLELPFYPFKNIYNLGRPAHFDMTKDLELHKGHGDDKFTKLPAGVDSIIEFKEARVPHICHVNKKRYEVCKLVNGEAKCQEEADDFLQQCPNFALNTFRNNKLFNQSASAIQRKEYHEAIEVSKYNNRRSVANIKKSARYADGSAHNLRPDSMWADDRYSDVTLEDIKAARERVLKRNGHIDLNKLTPPHKHSPDSAEYHHHHRLY